MPTYEYKCPSCGNVRVYSFKITENVPVNCHNCFEKGKPSQMIRGPGGGLAVHFKGSGFYETDYKGK